MTSTPVTTYAAKVASGGSRSYLGLDFVDEVLQRHPPQFSAVGRYSEEPTTSTSTWASKLNRLSLSSEELRVRSLSSFTGEKARKDAFACGDNVVPPPPPPPPEEEKKSVEDFSKFGTPYSAKVCDHDDTSAIAPVADFFRLSSSSSSRQQSQQQQQTVDVVLPTTVNVVARNLRAVCINALAEPFLSRKPLEEWSTSWMPQVNANSIKNQGHQTLPPSIVSSVDLTMLPAVSQFPVARNFDPTVPFPFDRPENVRRDCFLYFYFPANCPRGKHCPDGYCPLAHSGIEKMYHPVFFATQMCHLASKCTRRKCSFAHTKLDKVKGELLWDLWEGHWSGWRVYKAAITQMIMEKLSSVDCPQLAVPLSIAMDLRLGSQTGLGPSFPNAIATRASVKNIVEQTWESMGMSKFEYFIGLQIFNTLHELVWDDVIKRAILESYSAFSADGSVPAHIVTSLIHRSRQLLAKRNPTVLMSLLSRGNSVGSQNRFNRLMTSMELMEQEGGLQRATRSCSATDAQSMIRRRKSSRNSFEIQRDFKSIVEERVKDAMRRANDQAS